MRCVDKGKAQKAIHEGVCGLHMNGMVLEKKGSLPKLLLVDDGDKLCGIYEKMP